MPVASDAVHDIAFVDQADAGASGDRRDDVGVGQDGARIVDRRLVEFDLRLELSDHRLLRVELLLVDGVGGGEPGVALEIELVRWRVALRPALSSRPSDRRRPGR